ncbi:MAG: hypothetical protein OXI34_06355 [Chloroflexota bacterium]|nr:hypothetical protein [Chloroflexota bacterium]
MVAEAKSGQDVERLAVIETRMDSFVAKDQHERDNGDIKVALAQLRGEVNNLRTDIKNLTWQIAVVVAILSSIISFLVSRIPI